LDSDRQKKDSKDKQPGNKKTIKKKKLGEYIKEFEGNLEQFLSTDSAPSPGFPLFIITIAILKDCLDAPLDIVIVGAVITTLTSFIMAIILFFWVWGKLSGGWWKKKLIRWLWVRYVMIAILEILPFFKIVPAATIFVLMAHHREKKVVKLFNLALEEIKGAHLQSLK